MLNKKLVVGLVLVLSATVGLLVFGLWRKRYLMWLAMPLLHVYPIPIGELPGVSHETAGKTVNIAGVEHSIPPSTYVGHRLWTSVGSGVFELRNDSSIMMITLPYKTTIKGGGDELRRALEEGAVVSSLDAIRQIAGADSRTVSIFTTDDELQMHECAALARHILGLQDCLRIETIQTNDVRGWLEIYQNHATFRWFSQAKDFGGEINFEPVNKGDANNHLDLKGVRRICSSMTLDINRLRTIDQEEEFDNLVDEVQSKLDPTPAP